MQFQINTDFKIRFNRSKILSYYFLGYGFFLILGVFLAAIPWIIKFILLLFCCYQIKVLFVKLVLLNSKYSIIGVAHNNSYISLYFNNNKIVTGNITSSYISGIFLSFKFKNKRIKSKTYNCVIARDMVSISEYRTMSTILKYID